MLVICMGIKLCMIVWRQLWALSRTRGVSVNAEVALYAVLGTYHLHRQAYPNVSMEARLMSRLVKSQSSSSNINCTDRYCQQGRLLGLAD